MTCKRPPSVHLIVIAHDDVGVALLNTVARTLGELPLPTHVISVAPDSKPENIQTQLECIINTTDTTHGLLVLTDLYGSTPCNLANSLKQANISVIAGLNLPMLFRVMNYAELNLQELSNKALTGGRDGVVICSESTEHA